MAFLTSIGQWLRVLAVVLALGALSTARLGAQGAEVQREYAVKAVFLYNFCQFTTWPATSFGSAKAPITIGVLGSDPFGPLLEEAVSGETIDGRAIRIVRLRGVEDARQCQIVFVPRSAMNSANSLLNAVRDRSVLTVGETDGFLAAGGMISLATEQGKVRLRMNAQAIRGAALLVSSKLLRVANR